MSKIKLTNFKKGDILFYDGIHIISRAIKFIDNSNFFFREKAKNKIDLPKEKIVDLFINNNPNFVSPGDIFRSTSLMFMGDLDIY